MPGMEMPVRMTTAMLFFIVGGIATYYAATQNSSIIWVAQSAFVLFVALGPVYWIQELVLDLPWEHKRVPGGSADDYRFVPIEEYSFGRIVMWVGSGVRILLIIGAVRQAYFGLSALSVPGSA